MAAPDRSGERDLTSLRRLAADPRLHHVFHALRLIEASSDGPRLGRSRRPREDAVRLGQEAEMAFPATAIRSFTAPASGRPGRLVNRFFGFFGPNGPLPVHLTEYARERARVHRDPTLIAFADMLTHRLMSLLYRAWATGQPAADFDRGRGGRFEAQVAALSGHAGAALQDRDAMPDLARRRFSGHLARGPRNADGLVAILSAFFAAPVRIEQFVGSWLTLEPADRWRLGAPVPLGHGTGIGARVWSRAAKFRIRIGPLDLPAYLRLLPGQPSLDRLVAIVRAHVGDALDWDVNLVLAAADVPAPVLGRDARLGHTVWIGARRGGDAADLHLPGLRPRAPQRT
jgi:type VI secretion system protein ImpH